MQNAIKYKALILLTAVVAFSGCRKIFNLPEERDYLSSRADFTVKAFDPRLGRTTVRTGIFNADNSSFPMTFEIVNPRFGDGRDASDMLAVKPTLVWTSEYTGKEKSIAEIEAKRKLEPHPMVELRSSGDFVLWHTATKDLLKPADSIIYPQNIRYFDVKISNSGGARIIKNLQFTPRIDVPYEPSRDYNTITGAPNTTTPGGKARIFNFPNLSGIIRGELTNTQFQGANNTNTGLVYMYIRKYTGDGANGSSLRFKFLNKDSVAIDPVKFGDTKWNQLVHGFNMVKTTTYVQYDVAYPIPLARIPTLYTAGGPTSTGGGGEAYVEFSFSRLGFNNVRETGRISTNFQIFEKGDWEIVFHFKTVNPKFAND
ncbi:DUF5007 domain-containing protein [Pedobacter sp. JCM 36344]|uniref:DUF5007 domain-containing protein n=1 Tax=Pedobacter sp. JCM 36344 TaxID=3374280 RepID=UPI00397CFA09